MKRTAPSIVTAILLAAACGALPASPARAADAVIGKVVSARGHVFAVQGKKKRELHAGSPIREHETLRTASDARAIVVLGARDSAMLLKAGTELSVDRVKGKDWLVNLERGMVLSKINNPEKRPDHYRLKTKTAVMGVRGTVFFVKSEPGQPDFLCTCHGRVNVSSPSDPKGVTIEGVHHDHPKMITAGGADVQSELKDASVGSDHTDAEAAELVSYLKK